MSNHFLSIIIPVYNNKLVEAAISSVLNYKTNDIELIVIDGGSSDGTVECIQNFIDKIDYFISEPDRGMYDALNKGINNASGDWIFCLAADDILECDPIQIIHKYANANVDVICGNLIMRYDENKYSVCSSESDLSQLDFRCSLRHPASFFRRSSYEKFGLYNEKYICAGDRELFLRFRNRGAKFIFISEYIVLFENGGLSTGNPIKWAYKEDREISQLYGISKQKAEIYYLKRCIRYFVIQFLMRENLYNFYKNVKTSVRRRENIEYLNQQQVEEIFLKQKGRL